MSDVKNWPTLLKTDVDANHYLGVTGKKKLQVLSLFPSLATAGTGSESLYTGVTNSNQLNFKGIKSGDTGLLTVTTASNNIVLTALETGIDLSACNNTSSAFLATVNLTSNVGATVLPVANGGTNAAAFADKSVIITQDSGTDTLAAVTMSTNGQLLIGGTSGPAVATLTAGTGMTVTNGDGTITLAASLASAAAVLDMNTYNINLDAAAGTSWVSGDGGNEGITVDANGRVGMGDSTPTAISMTAQLNLFGAATSAINIGNNNSYKNHTIKAIDATGATAGLDLTVEGADSTVGNNNGGDIDIKAGDARAAGSGTSGSVNLYPGADGASASAGVINLYYYSGGTAYKGLILDSAGSVHLPKGPLFDDQTAQSLTGAGAISLTTSKTHFTDTGTNALTIADGAEGQHKYIFHKATSGGTGVLTPVNFAGGTTITFNAVGDTVHLMFTGGSWYVIGQNSIAIA